MRRKPLKGSGLRNEQSIWLAFDCSFVRQDGTRPFPNPHFNMGPRFLSLTVAATTAFFIILFYFPGRELRRSAGAQK